MMDYLPYPELAQLQGHDSFEQAMEAYAIFAQDRDYPYLVAWRPWLHIAGRLQGSYSDEPAQDATDDRHFSTRMSELRNRIVTRVFGYDGPDRAGFAGKFKC